MSKNLTYASFISHMHAFGLGIKWNTLSGNLRGLYINCRNDLVKFDTDRTCPGQDLNTADDFICSNGQTWKQAKADWYLAHNTWNDVKDFVSQAPQVLSDHINDTVSTQLPGFHFAGDAQAVLAGFVLDFEGIS